MPLRNRGAVLCLALTLILTLAAGCTKSSEPPPVSEEPTPSPSPSATSLPKPTVTSLPTPTVDPALLGKNPLTGEVLPEDVPEGRRPTAIMLNNLKKALPMSGNADADIIYEALAEGGITRMLGVYYSPDALEKIGTVRSARSYYLEMALGHDAIFVHAGGSYIVYNEIKQWGVKTLDYVNGGSYTRLMAWRDEYRRKNVGSEHSVYTSGQHLLAAIEKAKVQTEQREGYTLGWSFAENSLPSGGTAAENVSIPFTNKKSTVFHYDAATRLYAVEEYDKPFMDEMKDAQVTVTNVLALHTDVSPVPGDKEGRLNIRMTGEGTGYWAAGGKVVPIHWSKKTRDDPFVFTTEDGKPVQLAVGKSYIGIINMTAKPVFS